MDKVYNIPREIKAISFDVWGTLIRGNTEFTWPRLELVFGQVGILEYGRNAITQAYRKAEAYLNKKAEETGIDTGMAERIEFVLTSLGVTDKAVPDQETIRVLQLKSAEIRMLPQYRPSLTEPNLIEILQKLREAGYRLGTLSNTGMGDSCTMAPIFKYYGFDELFSVKLFSCDDGRAKPNPGFFQRIAAELEAEPCEVLHVGDSVNADCRAVEAGLNSVLYAPKGASENICYPTISSLKELLPR